MVGSIVGMSLQGGNMGKPIEFRQCGILQGLAILHLLDCSPGLAIGSILQGQGIDGMVTVIFDTGPRRTDFQSVRLCWAGFIEGKRQVLTDDVDLAPLIDRWSAMTPGVKVSMTG